MTSQAPPRRIVAILLLVIPLSQIPMDIYTPALPQMVIDLDATSTALQNTVTAYMLGMSLAFIPIGVLADAWGRKRVLLSCLVVVVATSLACAAATDVVVLLGVRFVQGAAACACLVLSYAVAADCFTGKRLTSVSGFLGAAWGTAPLLAPAVGGVLVQFISWRVVFVTVAALSAAVAVVVALALPETLAADDRASIAPRATGRVVAEVLRNRLFGSFVVVFGLLASAQLAFGVAGPFLYQDQLGFTPAAYGLIALVVGAANLSGELACGALAVRLSTRVLAMSALALFMIGAVVLVGSAALVGVNAWAITVGAALALAGCGVLCPQMYGLALGLFSRNLGLVGGIVSAGAYLIVSASMAVVGALPERSQAPLGWMYIVCGAIAFALLGWATSSRARMISRQPRHNEGV
jgi:DHA1 family bicyclomycin/chloramphenicol resistance-like MFS transporter